MDYPGMFSPVNADRLSQAIVKQVKQLIRDGRLKPGDRLPSEQEMCKRFHASRVTVREAVRILETSGMLEVRVGSRGGSYLASPTTERLGEGLADIVSLSTNTTANVTEARIVFEFSILPLVVQRATEEDIEAMYALLEEHEAAFEVGRYDVEMSGAFHLLVAACTQNPTIGILLHSLHGPVRMSVEGSPGTPLRRQGLREHRQLVDMIAKRDLDGARELMTAHLNRPARRVNAQLP